MLTLSWTNTTFPTHKAVSEVLTTLAMNVKDRKYPAWFLPKLSLGFAPQIVSLNAVIYKASEAKIS